MVRLQLELLLLILLVRGLAEMLQVKVQAVGTLITRVLLKVVIKNGSSKTPPLGGVTSSLRIVPGVTVASASATWLFAVARANVVVKKTHREVRKKMWLKIECFDIFVTKF